MSTRTSVSADWTIEGAEGAPIRGQTHAPEAPRAPEAAARLAALVAHGFKGYKDYGFIPVLAEEIARRAAVAAHRFNFSHSGVGEDPTTFERPDLFERDSRNKQVFDLNRLLEAARLGKLPSTREGARVALIGHSRGGVAALLAAGRAFRDDAPNKPAGVAALSAPSRASMLSEREREEMLETGYHETVSARTGQTLRVGKQLLQEELDAPEDHDVLALTKRIECPLLIVHGEEDKTVPVGMSKQIAAANPGARLVTLEGGDHVFNTPNPADPEAPKSPQLQRLCDEVAAFLKEIAEG